MKILTIDSSLFFPSIYDFDFYDVKFQAQIYPHV